MDSIASLVGKASQVQVRDTLEKLLAASLAPAFGALPKRELELLLLDALIEVRYLSAEPSVYELVRQLRVTRSRARSLLYERELRRHSQESLETMARRVLSKPLIYKADGFVSIEVDSPLLSDYLKDRVTTLGYVSDGSFSPSLIRLSDSALVSLIHELIPEDQRDSVLAALHKAGLTDKSLKGALKALVMKAGSKFAAETGQEIMGDGAEWLAKLLEGKAKQIETVVKALLKDDKGKTPLVAG